MSPGESLRRTSRRTLARTPRERRAVAVTGADTFLGRNLIGILEEDDAVSRIVAIDVASPRTAARKTSFYKVDLTQPSVDARLAEILQAEDVHTFVHLAFLGSPTHAAAYAHELESVGTMHVLNACRERRIRKFVMSSQTLLYGPSPSNPNFLTEDHPLHGLPESQFTQDKIEAEHEARRFGADHPESIVTILRFAAVLGPTVRNWVSRWLSRRLVPTVMGFDPLVQFVHEMDAVAALKLALDRDVPGTFNIVGDGVLPVSTVVKLAGRVAIPIPHFLARPTGGLLWAANMGEAPPVFLTFLRYLCVADGARATRALGFRPAYSTREAVLDFAGALRLREARLLQEAV
jgi:UDP-glucose 4-epimerase